MVVAQGSVQWTTTSLHFFRTNALECVEVLRRCPTKFLTSPQGNFANGPAERGCRSRIPGDSRRAARGTVSRFRTISASFCGWILGVIMVTEGVIRGVSSASPVRMASSWLRRIPSVSFGSPVREPKRSSPGYTGTESGRVRSSACSRASIASV
ncbi:MAG: hypothetical protein UY76_C0007G0010 [Candidatus Uhrbacteria bacterium GW2011_GWA2_52_8d]|uniref:Uncharacterized protein n=1 Tax=Candidatus Uhrbacteria bacterium GW2011_GWA2_52_8d TaxID=1618979 RepID=A0A0G2AKT1_9BACT|nr:MAG: hypothetical protein UY76_C0007G0010 [Candidatus Uhrbacteria bacterium GW2011_GWA2_52_8d]